MVQGENFSMIHPLIVHIPGVEDIHEIFSPVEEKIITLSQLICA